jgi:hypothetical protein
LLFLLVSSVLAIVFASARRPPVTTPMVVAPLDATDGDEDLACAERGAQVRVSTWDLHRRLHPLFAIDAEPLPTDREAWAPEPDDPTPRIEVLLPRATRVQSVALWFATRRDAETQTASYDVSCRREGVVAEELESSAARGAVVVHRLARCRAVDEVRVEFHPIRGVEIRVYEIEVRSR